MDYFRFGRVRFLLVPVAVISFLSACGGWQVQEMAPNRLVKET